MKNLHNSNVHEEFEANKDKCLWNCCERRRIYKYCCQRDKILKEYTKRECYKKS